MRLVIRPAELAGALSVAGHAVPARTTVPILSSVLLQASAEGALSVTATDLDLAIRVSLAAVVEEPGDAVLPYRYFFDMVRHMTEPELRVSVDPASFAAVLECGRGHYEVNGYDPSSYPGLPAPPTGTGVRVSDDQLRLWTRQTVFAAAGDMSRPALTGVLWEAASDMLRLVATDGTRLAYREAEAISLGEGRASMVVPARAMQQVLRMPSGEREVTVRVGSSHVWFEWQAALLLCRLLASPYPDYRQVVPREYVCRARVDRAAFRGACQRAALVSRDGFPVVRLQIEEGRIVVAASSPAVGRGEEEVQAEVEGTALEIAFNADLLLEGVEAVEGQTLLFAASGPQSVCLLRDADSARYCYYVLPLRQ
ncbi:MAG: DNA polymerase III subunit beta [Firmicutes bacterium]|nr:DNA polymerase III subunit beta [Bacillota bacterium]